MWRQAISVGTWIEAAFIITLAAGDRRGWRWHLKDELGGILEHSLKDAIRDALHSRSAQTAMGHGVAIPSPGPASR